MISKRRNLARAVLQVTFAYKSVLTFSGMEKIVCKVEIFGMAKRLKRRR